MPHGQRLGTERTCLLASQQRLSNFPSPFLGDDFLELKYGTVASRDRSKGLYHVHLTDNVQGRHYLPDYRHGHF